MGQDVRVRVSGRAREKATIVRLPNEGTVVLRFGEKGEEQAVSFKDVKEATLAVDWSKLGRSLARNARKESQ